MTRVYVPALLADLEKLAAGGSASAVRAFAATDRLAADYPDADDDELAYAAMTAARDDATTPRIVIAADLAVVEDPQDAGVVVPSAPITLAEVASFHVETDEQSGDLAWYATQELDDLIGALRGA